MTVDYSNSRGRSHTSAPKKGIKLTMLCEKCQQNEVAVHLTDIAAGIKKKYQLCKKCAEDHGVSIQAQLKKHKQFTLTEFYGSPQSQSHQDKDQATDSACSQCGMSYSLFRKEGKFGCSHDYQTFRSDLDELMNKIHASSQHRGRAPGRFRQQVSRQVQLDHLREELTQAVSDEQFEEAAKIRDQMRLLESHP